MILIKAASWTTSDWGWLTFWSRLFSSDWAFSCSLRSWAWSAATSDFSLERTSAISPFALRIRGSQPSEPTQSPATKQFCNYFAQSIVWVLQANFLLCMGFQGMVALLLLLDPSQIILSTFLQHLFILSGTHIYNQRSWGWQSKVMDLHQFSIILHSNVTYLHQSMVFCAIMCQQDSIMHFKPSPEMIITLKKGTQLPERCWTIRTVWWKSFKKGSNLGMPHGCTKHRALMSWPMHLFNADLFVTLDGLFVLVQSLEKLREGPLHGVQVLWYLLLLL